MPKNFENEASTHTAGLTAGAGDIIDVIPVGAAAGSTKQRNVIFKKGLFVDFGATTTGTVIAEYM